MERLGPRDKEKKKRPKSAAFGIGGAGRNIISSFDLEKFSNIDVYEVGEENRLDSYPNIKVFRKDVKKIITTKVSDKYREKTPSEKILKDKIKDYDILYILCGLGGKMGTVISKTCSKICKQSSVFSAALFTTPFKTESPSRIEFSDKVKSEISKYSDISVAFSNEKLLNMNPYLSLMKAFEVMNKIISIPMEDLNSIITKKDIVRLREFCKGVNDFNIGSGYGKGREKGTRAFNEALRSPWLEEGDFDKIIVFITKGKNKFKYDVQDVLDNLESRYERAEILYGVRKDKSINKRIRVTVLAGEDQR